MTNHMAAALANNARSAPPKTCPHHAALSQKATTAMVTAHPKHAANPPRASALNALVLRHR
jgi:hypothetical protein